MYAIFFSPLDCIYLFILNVYLFIYWLHHTACGILVPQSGIKPAPPILEEYRRTCWTTGEVPVILIWLLLFFLFHDTSLLRWKTPPSIRIFCSGYSLICIPAKSFQLCPTLCTLWTSAPGSFVCGIFQARILE